MHRASAALAPNPLTSSALSRRVLPKPPPLSACLDPCLGHVRCLHEPPAKKSECSFLAQEKAGYHTTAVRQSAALNLPLSWKEASGRGGALRLLRRSVTFTSPRIV